ncbi:MAG: LolA family protein [Elusimicrobiota bacterium]
MKRAALISVLALTAAAPSAPITVSSIAGRMDAMDDSLKSLSCFFTETIRMEGADSSQGVSGFIQYKKPNFLRIEYKTPEPQSVTMDGKSLWIWRPSANQAIQTDFKQWEKSEPLARGALDFGHYGRLLKDYDVSIDSVSAAGPDGSLKIQLTLRPKTHADFLLRMMLSTRDYFPTETELISGGVAVRSRFADVKFNPDIGDNAFHFNPPPDADVFRHFKFPEAPR